MRGQGHRLREDRPAFDLLADVVDHDGERGVVSLLFEDDEGLDDGDAGLDHRRELAEKTCSDFAFDFLRRRGKPVAPASCGARSSSIH